MSPQRVKRGYEFYSWKWFFMTVYYSRCQGATAGLFRRVSLVSNFISKAEKCNLIVMQWTIKLLDESFFPFSTSEFLSTFSTPLSMYHLVVQLNSVFSKNKNLTNFFHYSLCLPHNRTVFIGYFPCPRHSHPFAVKQWCSQGGWFEGFKPLP